MALRFWWVVGVKMALWRVVEVEVERRTGRSEAMALWKGYEDGRWKRKELAKRRERWGIEVVESSEETLLSRFGKEWEVVDGFLRRKWLGKVVEDPWESEGCFAAREEKEERRVEKGQLAKRSRKRRRAGRTYLSVRRRSRCTRRRHRRRIGCSSLRHRTRR